MIRETQGPRGQIVTTWGRDLQGDLWVGEERPISFTVTCRCGKAKRSTGFPSATLLRKLRFLCMNWEDKGQPEEWFCSIECAVKHEPVRADKRALELRAQATKLNTRATNLQDLVDRTKFGAPNPL